MGAREQERGRKRALKPESERVQAAGREQQTRESESGGGKEPARKQGSESARKRASKRARQGDNEKKRESGRVRERESEEARDRASGRESKRVNPASERARTIGRASERDTNKTREQETQRSSEKPREPNRGDSRRKGTPAIHQASDRVTPNNCEDEVVSSVHLLAISGDLFKTVLR